MAQVGLLSGLNMKRVDLILPESERRELYFVADEIMQPGSGCYYLSFSDEVCYDENNKCLSYPSSLYRLQENFNVIRMPPSLKFI